MDTAYLDQYEAKLQNELLKLCTDYHMLDSVLLETDDINAHWKVIAPEYVADAVRQVADYPVVSVAWAAYLGMAIAQGWDKHWEIYSRKPYTDYYGEQGFDDMDEHIVQHTLKLTLESPEAHAIEDMLRRCGEKTVSLIRFENIEPGSPMAFHVFARSVKVMYRIGAALQLYRLGYRFQRVDLGEPNA